MLSKKYEFESKLWKWSGGKSSWYFLSLPQTESIDIKTNYPFAKRGFGSIPVAVIINDQIWTTSIFPDSSNNRYILPVKKKHQKSCWD
ncbi:MAG: DUF1905 domain-containing protein [Thermales bacterium]|nr:DUF1905 domain-containing protein [Thermales bacterium]